MTDRTVAVELRLKAAQYLAGLSAVKKATLDVGSDLTKATAQNHRNMEKVGRAGLIAGGAVAAGLGFAVKAAADFDKALSGVEAVANATTGQMDKLRQAALDAGAATVFSASDAARAEAELAKAGVSVKDILGGGLSGALDLAAAGQLELADAATIAAQSMNIFKLEGRDVTHIADVLAAGANKSAADVGELGTALRQGGLVAAQANLSLEETIGGLSAFADSALVGSDAGTSFKTMLQRLTAPIGSGAAEMKKLGLSVYDAQGNVVGLAEIAGRLQAKLGRLSVEQRNSALSTIFGSDAIRAANVLYDQGELGIRDYTKAVNDNGAAQRMAATQLDNLAGDFEALKGSIETALIQSGSGANEALRGMTQGATDAVNAFSGLPKPVQQTGFGLAAVSSGALLALGGIGSLLPKVRESRDALRGLGAAGVAADRGLGRLGKIGAIGAIAATAAVGMKLLTEQINNLTGNGNADVAQLTNSLVHLGDAGKASGEAARLFGADLSGVNVAVRDASKPLADLQSGFGLLPSRVDTAREKLDAIDQVLTGLVTGGNGEAAADLFRRLAENLPADKVDDFRTSLDGYAGALAGVDTESVLADDSTTDFAGALDEVSPAAQSAADAVDNYKTILEDTAAIDAYTATAELSEAFKDLTKNLKDGGKVTDEEVIKLGGFATEVKRTAGNLFENGESQKKVNGYLRDGRRRFAEAAEAAGYGADEAKRLAKELIRIPPKTPVSVEVKGVQAADAAVRRLARRLHRLNGTDVAVTVGAINRANASEYASGGIIPGPPSRSDTVPAWLSTGEYVVNSAATAANRGLLDAINSGQMARFADGGYVRGSGATSSSSGAAFSMTNTIVAPDPIGAGQAVSRQVQNDLWAAGLL